MVVGRWSLANPAGEPPTTADQRPEISEHIAGACVTFLVRCTVVYRLAGLWNPLPISKSGYGDCYVLPQQVISGYDLQCCSGGCLPGIPLSIHSCSFRSPGAGCLYGRVAGRGIGRPGSGDYDRGHRGDPSGHGNPLPLRHGFGGTIHGGSVAAGRVFRAGGGGRDVAADFAADSGRDWSGNAVDVQAEGSGTEGDYHGGGCSADGRDESEFGIGAAG